MLRFCRLCLRMALIFLLRPTSGEATSSVSSSLLRAGAATTTTGVTGGLVISLRGEGSARPGAGVDKFSKP